MRSKENNDGGRKKSEEGRREEWKTTALLVTHIPGVIVYKTHTDSFYLSPRGPCCPFTQFLDYILRNGVPGCSGTGLSIKRNGDLETFRKETKAQG